MGMKTTAAKMFPQPGEEGEKAVRFLLERAERTGLLAPDPLPLMASWQDQ